MRYSAAKLPAIRHALTQSVVHLAIVGKGGPTPPPFSKILHFLEIQDVPTFYRSIRKTKVLNESFNQLLYKLYPQSIFILEEYLLKW